MYTDNGEDKWDWLTGSARFGQTYRSKTVAPYPHDARPSLGGSTRISGQRPLIRRIASMLAPMEETRQFEDSATLTCSSNYHIHSMSSTNAMPEMGNPLFSRLLRNRWRKLTRKQVSELMDK